MRNESFFMVFPSLLLTYITLNIAINGYNYLKLQFKDKIMYGEEDAIKEDIRSVLNRNGYSAKEFKISIENGSSYDPNQIVGAQVWITIEKNSIKKQYELYRSDWPNDFETDLKNGYFNF